MNSFFAFNQVSHTYTRSKGIFGMPETHHAVQQVSFALEKGKTVGLVGESGCGKSTIAKIAVGLVPPTSGQVQVLGQSLYTPSAHNNFKAFRHSLCQQIQMIFQDPFSSLNPRLSVLHSVKEPLICTEPNLSSAKQTEKALTLLAKVGIRAEQANNYPHEFSGGQRQRIAIARALITNPSLVVCDEPTSSLDSSVQAQILNLLLDMQDELGVSYLFISHDLAVIRHMSDTVMVMYAGFIVEQAPTHELFANPYHPYTQLLFSSTPMLQSQTTQQILQKAPSASAPSSAQPGCLFAAHCLRATSECNQAIPSLQPLASNNAHSVRCFACT